MVSQNTDVHGGAKTRRNKPVYGIYIIAPPGGEAEMIKVLKQLAKEGKLLSPNVTIKNADIDLINEEDRIKTSRNRIKTTIGLDREIYNKLKALSVATKEDMQDIVAKALQEYFEKEDIRRILATYFASVSNKSTGFKSSDPTYLK